MYADRLPESLGFYGFYPLTCGSLLLFPLFSVHSSLPCGPKVGLVFVCYAVKPVQEKSHHT